MPNTKVTMVFVKPDGSTYKREFIATGAIDETTDPQEKRFNGWEVKTGESTTPGDMKVQKDGKFFDLQSQKHEPAPATP